MADSYTNFIKGRGTPLNPPSRFEKINLEPDPDAPPDEIAARTQLFRDETETIINYNDSPDVGFNASVNPYRGCEHGCIYCFARPFHEYLGFSSGLDFETKIMVKERAPLLLRQELARKSWVPQVIAMSGVTDCYQPIERRLRLTRGCLEVLCECRNPVCIITKSQLVTRDIDLLQSLAERHAAIVNVSVTTLLPSLASKLEPRASLPAARLSAIRELSNAGIPVGVLVAPVIPALNEPEIPAILEAAADAGARKAGYVPIRLPYGLTALFDEWLARYFPDRKQKILNRIRSLRGGKLNDPNFGSRMEGEGIYAEQMAKLFEISCRRVGLNRDSFPLSADDFRRPTGRQLEFQLP